MTYIERFSYEDQLNSEEWQQKRFSVLKRDDYKCRMCGCKQLKDNSLSLQVHHRYYLFNHSAWQYDDSALITLCSDCHELIHKTISPLIYTIRKGQLIRMNFTPCRRCGGAGWFPEYKNIQGGICFRCHGARYEELIDKNNIDDSSFMSSSEVFDVIVPKYDDVQLENLYQEAESNIFEGNGHSFDLDKALKIYRIAAINGHPRAQNNYALFLDIRNRNPRNNTDYSEEILRFTAYSALQGIYQAQLCLSEMFEKGKYVSQDINIAERWKRLSELNENKHFESIVKSLTFAESEEEISKIFNNLSPYEYKLVGEALNLLSKKQKHNT